MTKSGGDQAKPVRKTVVEAAFPGDEAPPELSVGIVSLVELCKLAMPDPGALRQRLEEARCAT